MDKEMLVKLEDNVKALVEAFRHEGRELRAAALVPIFPGWQNSSFTLLVDADWLWPMTYGQGIREINRKIFEVIKDPSVRKKMPQTDILLKGNVYEAGTEALIIKGQETLGRFFRPYALAETDGVAYQRDVDFWLPKN